MKARILSAVLLWHGLMSVAAAQYPQYSWNYGYPGTTAPTQPVTQQQTQSLPADQNYWNGYRYRPLSQRPGLPPNSSGNPGTTSYSYSARTPDGGYSYSIHIQQRGYPGYQQSYQQAVPTLQESTPPTVEATLSERRPVVEQNLIYRIRVHGSGNLEEAAPVLPQLDGLVFRQLGKPQNYRSGNAPNEVITEYTYLLIPLREGTFQLPPPVVEGRYVNGQPFRARGEHGLALYVQPAHEEVSPWLPLYDLRLEEKIEGENRARAGEPLTLEIIARAVGAVGSQLPSVASQLKSEDFYIYPGETTEEGGVSPDGLDLVGTRIERFTLVPRYGGKLTLPAITLKWWNLRTGQPATASVPVRQLEVAGPVGENRRALESGSGLTAGKSLYFWIPLGVVLLLLALGWLKVIFGHGRGLFHDLKWKPQWQGDLGRLQAPVAAVLHRLSLRRQLHRLRTWLGRHLPVSWKLWYCLRAVDREQDPASWEHALQILAARHLGARSNASMSELADIITRCHPAANAAEIRRLLEQLEASNYGGRPIDDFAAWKAAFQQQIRPRLFPIRLRHCALQQEREQGLPQLNPTP